jgi:hypothetical protein
VRIAAKIDPVRARFRADVFSDIAHEWYGYHPNMARRPVFLESLYCSSDRACCTRGFVFERKAM